LARKVVRGGRWGKRSVCRGGKRGKWKIEREAGAQREGGGETPGRFSPKAKSKKGLKGGTKGR